MCRLQSCGIAIRLMDPPESVTPARPAKPLTQALSGQSKDEARVRRQSIGGNPACGTGNYRHCAPRTRGRMGPNEMCSLTSSSTDLAGSAGVSCSVLRRRWYRTVAASIRGRHPRPLGVSATGVAIGELFQDMLDPMAPETD